ncbi:hypothetical protein SteCoe_27003 [Stentor coeruleus]|uniref:Uncharacterized protein n=1 Tax=Stentor coeruleus TaxID=5963 RepID=A0A1R2BBJ2_9CILI|nr:hypothetical protein SteCoe_27003 [Stentor coeruleus]
MKPRQGKSIKINKSSTIIVAENPYISSANESTKIIPSFKKVLKDRFSDNSQTPYISAKNILVQNMQDTGRLIKHSATGKKETIILKDLLPGPISPHISTAIHRFPYYFPKIKQNERVSLNKNHIDINNMFSSTRYNLKYLEMSEDLDLNAKILHSTEDFKAKTWIESIISLKEKKKNRFSLIEDLKFANNIFRDLVIRLKSIGKENESIVLDKFWRFVLETFDNHLDLMNKNTKKTEKLLEDTQKASEQAIKLKTEWQKKDHNKGKNDVFIVKNSILGKEKKENEKFLPFIGKVYACIDDLDSLCWKNEKVLKKSKDNDKVAEEKILKMKGKKRNGSMESPVINISSISEENLNIMSGGG